MRKTRHLAAALISAFVLAGATGSAAARNFTISNQSFRVTWASLEFEASSTIRCAVTFEGSFHSRTIAKVERSLIGSISRAVIQEERCTNGGVVAFNGVERYNGATPPNTLPWHLTYESFTGTLPAISGIRFLFSRFRFGAIMIGCTGQYGTETDNMTFTAARENSGGITTLTPSVLSAMTLFRRDGGVLCNATAGLRGAGSMTQLNSTSRINVNLI